MVTRYMRDASGNVMTIYKDTTILEQPIYGSTRLGMKVNVVAEGTQVLGKRNYELSNHLGNVLTVITDNMNMQSDSAWVSVVSTSDYYPFGLEMEGRSWKDTTSLVSRYGFNGKEKDTSDEWGSTTYDYGFRIYNPTIAKFLSVDPLTKEYVMLTPYQFASNMPIVAIDIDGLEAMLSIYGSGTAGDEAQFKKEANDDIKRGIAKGVAIAAFTAENFVDLLVTETKNQGSIGYIFISSHGSGNGVFFDMRRQSATQPASGSALNVNGEDWPKYGFKNMGIDAITNNTGIAFDKNALVVFAGCNMGITKTNKPGMVFDSFARNFTLKTGVPTIAAEGSTMPSKDGNGRTADSNYYLFEKINGQILQTDIGKTLTPDLIKDVYEYLKMKNEPEPVSKIKMPDLSELFESLKIPKPSVPSVLPSGN